MQKGLKILYDTKYLSLKSAPTPCGSGEWVYAHRPNVKGIVIIVPYIKDNSKDNRGGRILFLKTNRPPLASEGFTKGNIELPAGLVGDVNKDETLEEAAVKELLEETGLVAERIEVVTRKLSSSGGCTSEVCSLVLAHISDSTRHATPQSDGGVIQECIEVKLEDIPKWLKEKESEGCTISAQSIAGVWYLLNSDFCK